MRFIESLIAIATAGRGKVASHFDQLMLNDSEDAELRCDAQHVEVAYNCE